MLLSREFVILIIVSFSIAAPVAWYYSSQWLDRFVYRIDLDALVFIIAGVGTLAIAGLTAGLKSAQAAIVNPSESLKDE